MTCCFRVRRCQTQDGRVLLIAALATHLPHGPWYKPVARSSISRDSRVRLPRLGKAMSNLLDEAMEQFGGKEHHCESLSLPRCGFVDASALEHPVSIKDFITNVCQRPEGLKTCPLTFDVHWNIPGFGNVARLGEVIQSNHLDDLPDAVRLKKQLPPTSKVGLIVHNLESCRSSVSQKKKPPSNKPFSCVGASAM